MITSTNIERIIMWKMMKRCREDRNVGSGHMCLMEKLEENTREIKVWIGEQYSSET
jgi:hypothetical protein